MPEVITLVRDTTFPREGGSKGSKELPAIRRSRETPPLTHSAVGSLAEHFESALKS